MCKNNVLLLSINSPSESTGGGHYFRTLISGYSKNVNKLIVIGKSDENNMRGIEGVQYYTFNKSLISDLISRLFLSPSFLFFYIFAILKYIQDVDIVAVHSSRLGLIVGVIRLFFPKKKVIVHFDNNESHLLLLRLKKPNVSFRYFLTLIDFILIHLSEKISLKLSHRHTFITENDACSFNKPVKYIIPICLGKAVDVEPICGGHVLFTASFDFEPNILALKEYVEIAKKNSSFLFVVAGRRLSQLDFEQPKNLSIFSDPSDFQMDLLFKKSSFYISCVNTGSGMKTKVAEAMKYQIPILATSHSLIGYEDIIGKNYLFNYKYSEDITSETFEMLLEATNRQEIFADYTMYYSYKRVESVIYSLLSGL